MGKLSLAFAALWTALVSFSTVGQTGEFGNIFGSEEVERASREASAKALEGFTLIFQGLRLRELRENSGSEAFTAAADRLDEAGNMMIALAQSGKIPDEKLSESQFNYLSENLVLSIDPGQELVTLPAVYMLFGKRTAELAGLIRKLSDQENVFTVLLPEILNYMQSADVIARLREVK